MKQLRRVDLKRFLKRKKKELSGEAEIALVLFGIDYQANLGSIFRVADAVGVKKIYLTGGTIAPTGEMFERVARYKQRVVEWEQKDDVDEVLAGLKQEGFEIVAVEITDESIRFDKFDYKKKTCLLLGNEGHGLPDKVLTLVEKAVYIPMLGKGGSLNVSTAGALVAFAAKMAIDG